MSLSRRSAAMSCPAGGVAALLCAVAAASATAQGLIVVPRPASGPARSYFKLRALPGGVAHAGAIELRNPTSRTLRVALSAVDGQTLATLGSTYAPPGSRAHGATRWLRIATPHMALAPGQAAAVPIVLAVPRSARSGDRLSGVSIEALNQRPRPSTRGAVSIASVDRYAIGVETTLPGVRRALIRFTGAAVKREPAGLTFLLYATNPGNVILQGVYGSVRITRAGHTVVARAIEPGTFVSGTSIAYPVPAFGERPTVGTRYRVRATLVYPGGSAHLSTTVTFGRRQAIVQQRYGGPRVAAAPGTAWWKIALVAVMALYALATTTLLLRRRARPTNR